MPVHVFFLGWRWVGTPLNLIVRPRAPMDQALGWSAMTYTVARRDAWSGWLGVNSMRRALRFVHRGMFFLAATRNARGSFVPERAVAFFPAAA